MEIATLWIKIRCFLEQKILKSVFSKGQLVLILNWDGNQTEALSLQQLEDIKESIILWHSPLTSKGAFEQYSLQYEYPKRFFKNV